MWINTVKLEFDINQRNRKKTALSDVKYVAIRI